MSGLEVPGLVLGVLGVFPVLISAVKIAVKGRVAPSVSSWARKLRTEEVLFHQFVSHLLAPDVSDGDIQRLLGNGSSPDLDAWKDPRLEAALLKKLGNNKAGNMMEILGEIRKLLLDLSGEIGKVNNATDSLGRRIIRNAKIGLTQGKFINEQLKELHALNVDLTRLLKTQKPSSIMTVLEKPEGKPDNKLFLHRDMTEAQEIYELIRQSFGGCKCQEPHITRLGYHCPSCDLLRGASGALEHEHVPVWELIFQPKSPLPGQPSVTRALSFSRGEDIAPSAVEDVTSESGDSQQHEPQDPTAKPPQASLSPDNPTPRPRSISVSLQSPPTTGTNLSLINDLCTVIETAPSTQKILGIIGRNKKTYNMCINEKTAASTSHNLISLEDLLTSHSRLLRRERMVLALRLSAVVLQFYLTPWIDDEWSWKNFAMPSIDDSETNSNDNLISHLLVQSMFYSSASLALQQSHTSTNGSILSYDEPILTRLGFALTELAVGCTLEEISERELKQKPVAISDLTGIDRDTLKLSTCFKVLESGLIARTESHGYEAVVRACLKHQYRDRCKAGVKGLDSKDGSFFDNVEEAIITPLYEACSISWDGI